MRIDRREVAAIFVGGIVGALGRLGMVELVLPHPGQWPSATFTVNIAASLVAGFLAVAVATNLVRRARLTA